MNLIDADSVTLDMSMYNSFSVGMPLEERLRIMLERQPTVEAIPVEWLKKHSCFNVVDLWRKDCQLQDAKDVVCSILKEYNFNSYDEFIRYAWKVKAAAKLVPPEKLNEIIVKKDTGEENENR